MPDATEHVLALSNVVDVVRFVPPLDDRKLLNLVHEWHGRHPPLTHAGSPRLRAIWLGTESAGEWLSGLPRGARKYTAIDEEQLEEIGLGIPGVNVPLNPLFCLPPGWLILEGQWGEGR